MLASALGPPRIGTLAVAAWAAHVAGDEDAEHRYASELGLAGPLSERVP